MLDLVNQKLTERSKITPVLIVLNNREKVKIQKMIVREFSLIEVKNNQFIIKNYSKLEKYLSGHNGSIEKQSSEILPKYILVDYDNNENPLLPANKTEYCQINYYDFIKSPDMVYEIIIDFLKINYVDTSFPYLISNLIKA